MTAKTDTPGRRFERMAEVHLVHVGAKGRRNCL